MKPPAAHHCSFCGRTPAPDSRLVAGPGVQICAECVRLCAEIMTRDPPAPARPAGRLVAPRDSVRNADPRLHGHQQATLRRDRAENREMIARQRHPQDRGLAPWRGIAHRACQQIEPGFINPDNHSAFSPALLLTAP
jgi:hypothetical protein